MISRFNNITQANIKLQNKQEFNNGALLQVITGGRKTR